MKRLVASIFLIFNVGLCLDTWAIDRQYEDIKSLLKSTKDNLQSGYNVYKNAPEIVSAIDKPGQYAQNALENHLQNNLKDTLGSKFTELTGIQKPTEQMKQKLSGLAQDLTDSPHSVLEEKLHQLVDNLESTTDNAHDGANGISDADIDDVKDAVKAVPGLQEKLSNSFGGILNALFELMRSELAELGSSTSSDSQTLQGSIHHTATDDEAAIAGILNQANSGVQGQWNNYYQANASAVQAMQAIDQAIANFDKDSANIVNQFQANMALITLTALASMKDMASQAKETQCVAQFNRTYGGKSGVSDAFYAKAMAERQKCVASTHGLFW